MKASSSVSAQNAAADAKTRPEESKPMVISHFSFVFVHHYADLLMLFHILVSFCLQGGRRWHVDYHPQQSIILKSNVYQNNILMTVSNNRPWTAVRSRSRRCLFVLTDSTSFYFFSFIDGFESMCFPILVQLVKTCAYPFLLNCSS